MPPKVQKNVVGAAVAHCTFSVVNTGQNIAPGHGELRLYLLLLSFFLLQKCALELVPTLICPDFHEVAVFTMFFKRFASTLPLTIRQILASGQDSASKVHIHGWVKSVRRQKNVTFAVVNDARAFMGMSILRDLGPNDAFPSVFDAHELFSLTNGASVRMTGTIVVSPGAGQAQELQVDSLEILGECNPDAYPIQKQALTLEYLRDHAHLRPRTDANAAMLRLRNSLVKSLHTFFERQDFCYVHTPILTSNDCEGAGETFRVIPASPIPRNIRTRSYIAGSPRRVFLQTGLLDGILTTPPRGPRIVARPRLHALSLFSRKWAWTKEVGDVCGLVEACVKDALGSGRDERALLAKGIAGQEEKAKSLETAAAPEPWARMTYTKAISELEKYHASAASRARPFTFAPKWGHGLQSEHEKWLSEVLVEGPVFITDYPRTLKPFYMRMNDDERTVACFDLLVPFVGELVGGSLREERLEPLQQCMTSHGLDPAGEEYGWYVDLRRYGSVPHGGFGMGLERLVSWVSGIENVRECIAMPRWAKRMLL
ncbi:hypothetical protein J3R83DRAFT_5044 [Lanmaoa asiatica]|nr:hypothetical protein J3R83DRAFT_5044 [Lanmaoa asiatica]